ncbi:sodium:solute symporter family protein [Patescibacteria group bacterium AH-259-L07]|nr:sodium:solute symporter family protein [Patescibacteria group bacterium AH-259-L07]
MGISNLDITIIFIYIGAMLGLGIFLFKKENTEAFFINNRKTKTALLLFTTLSTSIGAGTVLGMASAAYSTGISLGLLFAIATLIGWIVIVLVSSKIKTWGDRTKAFTLGDFFKSRYSNDTKIVGSGVILVSTLVFTSIQFVGFARLAEVIGGVNFEFSLIIAAIITIIYTVLAGLKGDFYTDAIQFFVMFPVFIFLFVISFSKVGLGELFTSIPKEFLSPFNYNGAVFFFAGILFGIPFLLVSMDVWQRILAAADKKTAHTAFFWGGILNVIFIAASVLLGILAFYFFPGGEGDAALFVLMKNFLPNGILGLGFASVLAILMSSIDSSIMVGSATLTKDFYLYKYPDSSEKKKLFVGRMSALIFGLTAFIIALSFRSIVHLIVIGAQTLIILAPAILGGLLWKRSNEKAAFWSILLGFTATIATMPFSLNMAFIPGVLTSIIIFLALTFKKTEKLSP